MKCINRLLLFSILLSSVFFTGCGAKYDLAFTTDSEVSSFNITNTSSSASVCDSFAQKLCISEANKGDIPSDMNDATGGLFDINKRDTIYAKNIYQPMYPASLTKIMTALVAIKSGLPLDTILTASSNVYIPDKKASVLGLTEGDQMSLEQALNVLLIYSANDVAILIAEGISGTTDAFVGEMNKEALTLGATGTHFVNVNGLHDDEQYTTPYDLYLMMNEAVQYDTFKNIIGKSGYQSVYYDAAGLPKEIDIESTNQYLLESVNAPNGVTVLGGKTGTTSMAGHCLVLYTTDSLSNNYISVIMKADNRDNLYKYTNMLLDKIGK